MIEKSFRGEAHLYTASPPLYVKRLFGMRILMSFSG